VLVNVAVFSSCDGPHVSNCSGTLYSNDFEPSVAQTWPRVPWCVSVTVTQPSTVFTVEASSENTTCAVPEPEPTRLPLAAVAVAVFVRVALSGSADAYWHSIELPGLPAFASVIGNVTSPQSTAMAPKPSRLSVMLATFAVLSGS